ncbi:MAG: conjugal transfer protein TraG N-terminal domain-containing protein [Betaproteobacteria bacterium]|nr:conjugal transfer protein TraG N-terminal domain-containing protein [Betaproteobacteria bacterium]
MYEIYSYGNNDALFGIFNAVAALVGANGYAGALAITVTAGFITALLAYAFAPDKLNGWKWLAGVVLIYSVLLVPRVNVGIVDKLGNQPVKVVANVPWASACSATSPTSWATPSPSSSKPPCRSFPATVRCRWSSRISSTA